MNKKVGKFISMGLISAILCANFSIDSLAATLSADSRYETFEGNDIMINNILEEETVDIQLKGNTMVNIFSDIIEVNTENIYSKYENNKLIFGSQDEYTGSISSSYIGQIVTNKDFIGGNTYTMYFKCNIENVKFGLKGRLATGGGTGSEYAMITKSGLNKFVFTLDNNISLVDNFAFRVFQTNTRDNHIFEDIMILEGDINYDCIDYFEGMQSSFENSIVTQEMIDKAQEKIENLGKYKVEVKTTGKNKLSGTGFANCSGNTFKFNEGVDGVITAVNTVLDNRPWQYEYSQYFVDLAPGTYTISVEIVKMPTSYYSQVSLFLPSGNNIWTYSNNAISSDGVGGKRYYTFTLDNYAKIGVIAKIYDGAFKIQVEEGSISTECEPYKESINTVYLSSPLLKDDTIEIVNGQIYHIKRNRQVTLNGSENWSIYSSGTKDNFITFRFYNNDMKYKPKIINDYFKVYEHKDWPSVLGYEKCILGGLTGDLGAIYISIPRSELVTEDIDGFKMWIKSNPVNIVYELTEPVYEMLNVNLSTLLFSEKVYISNNSIIPANMSVTVDRAPNRAKNFIEIAKLNPTVDNLTQARYWINLMKETILKDEFQNILNDITEIEDLQIDKKVASSNVDLYIKMKNNLSMSLDTNSISFSDYTSTEDMEMLGAINITIDSSLPYDLNVYMPTGIYNKDNSKSMDINVLNIKENTESKYQQFTSVNDKLTLKQNCEEGMYKSHSIDLKLSGGDICKADIYKTVLKFEVEQK